MNITRRRALISMAAFSQACKLSSAQAVSFNLLASAAPTSASGLAARPQPLSELQLAIVNLRFGMFIHFSPTTYLDVADHLMVDHAPPRQGRDGILGTADDLSPALVNPARLDCRQWAQVAASAKMRFGILTTKHHDGFCMWPSKHSTYTVAQGCKRDVVGEFASAFRERGLKVALYYSIRDRTERIAGNAQSGGVSREKIQLIKDQLTELLTNYGEILYILFDGWGNVWHESPSYYQIPYAEIHDHIKSLQPNCLVLNHTRNRYVSDLPHLELSARMEFPTGMDWPAMGGNTMQPSWFWRTNYPLLPLRSVDWIVNQNLIPDNKRNLVFLLNCAPNRDGLMDENIVTRMAEVGKAWDPPAPLTSVPDSWKNWPVPSSVHPFTGKNIALGMPVRLSAQLQNKPSALIVDGNPDTSIDLAGPNPWLEIDLGKSQPISGVQIWNRSPAHNVMLEQGFIFISSSAYSSDDPAVLEKDPAVHAIRFDEPPGYPTPYAVGASGRYVRIVSTSGRPFVGLAEVEVFS